MSSDRWDWRSALFHATDPGNEEHDPTRKDIEKESVALYEIRNRLQSIAADILNFKHYGDDRYMGADPVSPIDYIGELSYLEMDYIDDIQDPEARAQIKREIDQVMYPILEHTIPYLDTIVKRYGAALIQDLKSGSHRADVYDREIVDVLDNARYLLERLGEGKDEQWHESFAGDIVEKEKQFALYRREPYAAHADHYREKLFVAERDVVQKINHHFRYVGKQAIGEVVPFDESAIDTVIAPLLDQISFAYANMRDQEVKDEYEARYAWVMQAKQDLHHAAGYLAQTRQLEALFHALQSGGHESIPPDDVQTYKAIFDARNAHMHEIQDGTISMEVGLSGMLYNWKNYVDQLWSHERAKREVRVAPTNVRDALSTLGLKPGATTAEIRKAYRRLMRENHPDRNSRGEERAKDITAAYHALKQVGLIS